MAVKVTDCVIMRLRLIGFKFRGSVSTAILHCRAAYRTMIADDTEIGSEKTPQLSSKLQSSPTASLGHPLP
ncbi:hypothetical protein GUITHDRAFT_155128 [Guillardia theta CCMP2712]|uniref:Uncharacterized protein n=1 Tax=Guillardia theta (strain CCMP2712) TaxID=905079 RepID=L1IKR7_GUITC|nr:hypothetical protein GUITHDRAFT_155128 [Guillardia theta CCMP2712]EKX36838.1 hypothetical protein GUITHDRAFT_155128 [Guillardia theta CCMP2712]|eukprot:XP_005823818.1 hypothetical protein GUITHDRAFT_155128 [Guillardia theta CCMP2712]